MKDRRPQSQTKKGAFVCNSTFQKLTQNITEAAVSAKTGPAESEFSHVTVHNLTKHGWGILLQHIIGLLVYIYQISVAAQAESHFALWLESPIQVNGF